MKKTLLTNNLFSNLEKGFFRVTNVTETDGEPSRAVKTVIKGKGEPGYLLTGGKSTRSSLATP
jgi:hypothetical protein